MALVYGVISTVHYIGVFYSYYFCGYKEFEVLSYYHEIKIFGYGFLYRNMIK